MNIKKLGFLAFAFLILILPLSFEHFALAQEEGLVLSEEIEIEINNGNFFTKLDAVNVKLKLLNYVPGEEYEYRYLFNEEWTDFKRVDVIEENTDDSASEYFIEARAFLSAGSSEGPKEVCVEIKEVLTNKSHFQCGEIYFDKTGVQGEIALEIVNPSESSSEVSSDGIVNISLNASHLKSSYTPTEDTGEDLDNPPTEDPDDQIVEEEPVVTNICKIQNVNGELVALGNWDSSGLPSYLTESDTVSQYVLDTIQSALPEGKPVPVNNPEYIAEGSQPNIELIEPAEVLITFVDEGAGYKNVLGYYLYDQSNPPQTANDISEFNIIFPNSSKKGSGGSLETGMKVDLGVFEEGAGIGWFLIPDGWHSQTDFDGDCENMYFSDSDFNPEELVENKRHNVQLLIQSEELIILGFEDMFRDNSSDDDFNDVVYYVDVNPIEAVKDSGIVVVEEDPEPDMNETSDIFFSIRVNSSEWSEWEVMDKTLDENNFFKSIQNFETTDQFGSNTVYAKLKDEAGNVSEVYSKSFLVSSDDSIDIGTLPLYSVEYSQPTSENTVQYNFESFPSEVETESLANLSVEVSNNGSLVWNSGDNALDDGVVNVSYHWYKKKDAFSSSVQEMINSGKSQNEILGDSTLVEIYNWEGNRGLLDRDISFGESTVVEIPIIAPSEAGNFILAIDTIHEGKTWFSSVYSNGIDAGEDSAMRLMEVSTFKKQNSSGGGGELPDYTGTDEFGIGSVINCNSVSDSGLDIFTEAESASSLLISLPRGVRFLITAKFINESSEEWLKVQLPDGLTGWITSTENLNCSGSENELPVIGSEELTYENGFICNAQKIEFFANPSWASTILGTVDFGEKIYVLYSAISENGWSQIMTESGIVGWIAESFVCYEDPSDVINDLTGGIIFKRPYKTEDCECVE